MPVEPVSDTEATATSDADTEDQAPAPRSRSQSRRERRRKQAAIKPKQKPAMPPVKENASAESQADVDNSIAMASAQGRRFQTNEEFQREKGNPWHMQPFEWIGPDETSMNGPVTYARAMRGEIPMRHGDPNQRLKTAEPRQQQSALDEQDGLKLKLDLNLDVEVELKARVHGDLTLSLL
jgi:hypothetical protein